MEVGGKHDPLKRLNVITNNISAGGVYFKSADAEEFEIGKEMAFTIFMSVPITDGRAHTSTLEGSGRVVREDIVAGSAPGQQGRPWKGVAIEFDKPLKML